ncbi:tape measure domain-containing protein [Nitrosospira multiformis]|uniref:Tape measure domain-containing protein n=1 Tax=Nitrosospira multiformis TaxID=1231 RepID=A0A1H8P6J5_9PROT|nr:tape measure protein [Nitrosospira multiformis]SEO37421.1 tape measure domain-containing protein [Nitrosospira multiformis]
MNGNIGTLTIEMAANIARLQRDMDRAKSVVSRSVSQIRNLVSGLFAGMFAMVSIGELGKMADAVSNMDARLRLATKSQAEFAKAQEDIQRIAQSTKGPLEATANLYTRIAQALPDTVDRQRKAADTSHALALSLRISGATAEESASAMLQFSQAVASGVMRGEEFNSVNEAAPRVMQALADAIGVPVGQLREMAHQGKLTTDILVEGLGSQLPKLLKEAETLPNTIGTSWQAVRNELLLTVGEIDKITGASRKAAEGISLIAKALNGLRGAFGGGGDLFGWMIATPEEQANAAATVANLEQKVARMKKMRDELSAPTAANWINDFVFGDVRDLNTQIAIIEKKIAHLSALSKTAALAEEAATDPAAGMKKLLAEAEAKAKAAEAAKEAEKAAKAAIAAAKASEKAANDHIISLHQETEAIGLNAVQVKLLAAARAAAAAPLESQRVAIMASAQAWAEATIAQEENVEAARRLEAEEKKRLDGYASLIAADEKSLESLKQKNALLEYGAAAVAEMGQADLQAALDRAWAADNIDIKVIDMLERRLELSKQLSAEAKRGEALEAAKNAAKAASDAWQNAARDINRSLTDALLRGFESGKGFAENFRDSLKNMFQTLILRPVIDIVLSPMSRAIMGVMGGTAAGTASAATGGGASSILSALGGGLTSGLSSIVSGLGSVFGSSAVSAFGAGIGMSSSAAAGAAGAYGAAGMSGIGSAISMGSMLGTAAPFIGAMMAAGSLSSMFGSGKKIFGIKGDSPLNFIAPIIGIAAGLFGKGPKRFGSAELTGNFLEDGFHGEFQADWTRKVGLFGGKKRGRRGLGIERDQLDAVNGIMFGVMDVFDSLADTAGDATRSLSGWNFAVKNQIETEEQRAQLATDLANSLGAHLIPELVELQRTGESLADTAARVQAEYVLVNAALDLTGQRLNQIGLASIGLRDNLVQLLGGLQNAGSLLQPFFEGFYTDAERAASTSRLMNAELKRLGIATLPATREQFRALVEAQDLNTQAGQGMFAALLRLAPAFASVTDAMGQAAADAEAEAKRIRDSMQLLTTDSFATKFEYERYLQLAANAGVTGAQPEQVFEAPPAKVFPSFAVGTNSLPQDMTINAHAGERIIPAADNRELMQRLREPNESAKAMADEIKQLRSELKAAHLAIARNTASTAKTTDRMLRLSEEWNVEGMPRERAI